MPTEEKKEEEKKETELFVKAFYTDEALKELLDKAKEGNIPAMLAVLNHNIDLLNRKLDALIECEMEKILNKKDDALDK